MIKRLTTATAVLATAALMAAGGVALAQSGSKAHHKQATHHAAKHAARHSTRASHASETTGVDTDSIQSGDQTSPDAASSSQTSPGETSGSTETSGESSEATGSDGPGGHEDTPGAEVDNQFEGEQ